IAPKRTLTSAAPAMSQAVIRKLVADSVSAALEAQAATMANADNTNRNTEQGETRVARKCSYKEFMSCQPFNFKGTEETVGLICWFERTESIKKTEDEFYNLTVKGNDLKTYIRRFQELAILCPTMVPNSEKLMEVFIGGLPRSIEGNVTASKPQTLEEAITITQRLMNQVTRHNSVQGTNDHKRKFDDRRTFTNNNYQNNRNNNSNRNNDHKQQQNRRQETVRAYAATRTENSRYNGSLPLNCINKGPATRSNLQLVSVTCHACGEKGHYRNQCPKENNSAYGRAYLLKDKNAHQDSNVIVLVVCEAFVGIFWKAKQRSKDEAPDFIIKFLKMIQVRLKVLVRRIKTDNGTEFQNGVVERRNRTLIKAARTMLIYTKAPLFLWAESVATACYTQNRSIIDLRHGKTPYELLHDKLTDLSFFHVFGARCYLTNDSENLDFYELIAMASEHSSSEPTLHEMTPVTISSGLVPNRPPSTLFIPPSRSEYDLLFQPLFDELLTPPPSVDYPAPEVVAPIHEVVALVPTVSTGSPSSTNVNQDVPSPINSQTTPETQPPVIPNNVKEDNYDIEVIHMGNDPYFGIPISEVHSDQSSSSDIIYTIVHLDHQISEHNRKWTKDHPLENIIGELARPVSTMLQLHEQALFCYYDAFLNPVKPKTYKDALT
ncbi:integrase, catalytic region, zinc finger, CCHC-type containing protein, partial [Tanacetum coccineum]